MSKLQLLIKQLEATYTKPEEPKVEENVSANQGKILSIIILKQLGNNKLVY